MAKCEPPRCRLENDVNPRLMRDECEVSLTASFSWLLAVTPNQTPAPLLTERSPTMNVFDDPSVMSRNRHVLLTHMMPLVLRGVATRPGQNSLSPSGSQRGIATLPKLPE